MKHDDIRPWGQYWVLEDAVTHKVKRLEVNPGGRLSYQYHPKDPKSGQWYKGQEELPLMAW